MSTQETLKQVGHPLEPLTADEITKAVAIVRRDKGLTGISSI